ncbi:MAG: PQQ-binding-like beta-propeller repeat protein [Phycisphaerae bacterium]
MPARALLLALFALPLTTRADDWPQWRGPARTAHVPAGVAVPEKLTSLKTVWQIPAGNGLASPVVSGGKVFYLDAQGTKETVHAVSAADGKDVWSVPLDDLHKDSQSPAGPRCTPTVDGDRVYAQSCRGELQCLSAADGKVLWRTNYVKDLGATFIGEKGQAPGASRHGYTPAPLVDGDHLIVEAGGKDAGVVCFDKATGKVVWKSPTMMPGYAAPIVATIAGTPQVVCFMSDGLIGIDRATGKQLWLVPMKTGFGRHVTTPIVLGDLVIVASHQVGLVGVKVTKTGDEWKADKAYTVKEAAINFSSPVLVGQHFYGVGPQKNLICVEATTGKIAWSKDDFFAGNATRTHAGMILAGKNLLVLTDDGQLVMIAADPAAYREIGRAQACGTNWCQPAYANGRLYVRDAKAVYCLEPAQ